MSWSLPLSGTALVAVVFLVFPSIRKKAKQLLMRLLFRLGYSLYVSQLGYFLMHKKLITTKDGKKDPTQDEAHSLFPELTGADASVEVEASDLDRAKLFQFDGFRVIPLAMLADNYSYLIIDDKNKAMAAVDPCDPRVLLAELERLPKDLTLTHLLITHSHWDHAGGNFALLARFPKLLIVSGARQPAACSNVLVSHQQEVTFGGVKVTVLETPCHTKGHVVFQCGRALFTGDTLFTAGCGRFFEGNATQMYNNIYSIISSLPDDTVIFGGHEYTVPNLDFAQWLEGGNRSVVHKREWAIGRRARKFGTIPSTLGEEKTFNPYLRVHSQPWTNLDVGGNASGTTEKQLRERGAKVLLAIRKLKDSNAHINKAPPSSKL